MQSPRSLSTTFAFADDLDSDRFARICTQSALGCHKVDTVRLTYLMDLNDPDVRSLFSVLLSRSVGHPQDEDEAVEDAWLGLQFERRS